MKRFIALVLALVLACTGLCSCNEATIEGTWICKEVIDGYPDRMVLNEDGTGILDDTVVVTWDAESVGIIIFFTDLFGLTVELDSYEYELKGSKLYLDGNEYTKE